MEPISGNRTMLTESTEDTHRSYFERILLLGTMVHKGTQWTHTTVGGWVVLSPFLLPPLATEIEVPPYKCAKTLVPLTRAESGTMLSSSLTGAPGFTLGHK